jgi:hypothetical protein
VRVLEKVWRLLVREPVLVRAHFGSGVL